MSDITQDEVIEYKMGRVTNQKRRQAIEHAREFDPLVRHWFSLTRDEDREPLPALFREIGAELARRVFPEPPAVAPVYPAPSKGQVTLTPKGFRSEARVEWVSLADPLPASPAAPQPQTFPSHEIDQEARVVRLTYPAAEIPYGVARVTAEVDRVQAGGTLVVFRVRRVRGQDVRRAEVGLTDLKIPLTENSDVVTYVIPATDENLSEFPVAEIRQLGERCNGDWELQEAVESLLRRLERGVQS